MVILRILIAHDSNTLWRPYFDLQTSLTTGQSQPLWTHRLGRCVETSEVGLGAVPGPGFRVNFCCQASVMT